MGQGNIISIDLQANLGLIDRVIRAEEINEKMNGAAVVPSLLLIWDQACHTHSLYTRLSMYAPCVTMLPPSDLFVH